MKSNAELVTRPQEQLTSLMLGALERPDAKTAHFVSEKTGQVTGGYTALELPLDGRSVTVFKNLDLEHPTLHLKIPGDIDDESESKTGFLDIQIAEDGSVSAVNVPSVTSPSKKLKPRRITDPGELVITEDLAIATLHRALEANPPTVDKEKPWAGRRKQAARFIGDILEDTRRIHRPKEGSRTFGTWI
ncbi:MAG TPA: hypothetical protein VLG37_01440 [Candidatus Saccharimonadales bacterium]|nr:hypothetical protein [Candidatus Saccharimonadales bacterium]